MDALKNIISNVPEWRTKLSTLNELIDQRQAELIALNEAESLPSLPPKPPKRKSSTESLRPQEEIDEAVRNNNAANEKEDDEEEALLRNLQYRMTSASMARCPEQAIRVAHARARAQVRIKQRTTSNSSIDLEERRSKRRTRNMIIVYYDSFVQSFFEELVKFVSASRNLIRKARMAAKVAHIKRVAEIESQTLDAPSDPFSAGPDDFSAPLAPRMPPMLRASSRPASRFGTYGAGISKPTDAYDRLDKALEFVQSQSEKGAHLFLRDGKCTEEVNNIARRMQEAKDLAEKEMQRILTEEPELAKESSEVNKIRMHRPTLMRREVISSKPFSAMPMGDRNSSRPFPIREHKPIVVREERKPIATMADLAAHAAAMDSQKASQASGPKIDIQAGS
ncbi:hypothetical protein CFO_g5529 [Ceratocystis platani]|uniref:Uncharacterized protein n=1 Tax=Ceratocystis fimbriata f. sp. platani TaxID=88771 RepID=A0A0F8AW90_CERFI|nr:hypothetical protein CFO_g5529 [Ceratocystis platani]